MEAKVSDIIESALYVDDLAESAAFYERVLGFRPTSEPAGRLCALEVTANQVLLLFKKGGSIDDTVTPLGTIPGTDGEGNLHVAFGIPAGDYGKWHSHLTNCGLEVVRKGWLEGGDSLYFRDPDNHVIEIKTSNWHGVGLQ